MFKMLEKLINEHGSANILKERLGLKDDQIVSLQKEFSFLTKENANLKSENQALKVSLDQAKQEINRLQEIINVSAKSESTKKLNEIEEQILRFLFDNNSELRIEQIANIFKIDINITKYHINNLLDNKLLCSSIRIGCPATYKINKNGIKHVVESRNT